MLSIIFPQVNGEYSFQINRTELFEKLGITFPTILEVEAEVTETLTGKTLSNVEEIQYFDREEKLVFLEGADNFKPGLKYTGYVCVCFGYFQTKICLSALSRKKFDILQYNITCIQRPLKESNESGLLLQLVFEWRFY